MAASAVTGVAGLEEACDRPGRPGNDEHGPDLEADVDDATRNAEWVLDLRGDGQQLHRGKEECVEHAMDVGLLDVSLEHVHKAGTDCIDDDAQD